MDAVALNSADIARLAKVRPTAVSNWRKRHSDFPQPIAGTETSPRFDLDQVLAWLRAHGKAVTLPAEAALLQAVTAAAEYTGTAALAHAVLLLLHPPVDEVGKTGGNGGAGRTGGRGNSAQRGGTGDPEENGGPARPGDPAARLRAAHAAFTSEHAGPTGRAARGTPTAPAAPPPNPHPSETAVLHAAADFAGEPASERVRVGARLVRDVLARRGGDLPAELAALLVTLSGAGPGDTLLDPACGTGGVLVAAAPTASGSRPASAAPSGPDSPAAAVRLLGETVDPADSLLTALRLRLAGLPAGAFEVHAADALRPGAYGPGSADAVVFRVPGNDREWAADEVLDAHPWPYGIPSGRDSELAWIQVALGLLRPGGTAAVLVPAGVADRPSGRAVRRALVRGGALRAVVALPKGSLDGTAAAPHIWVLTPAGGPPGDARVLMLDLSEHTASGAPDWAVIARCAESAASGAALPAAEGRRVPAAELLDEQVDFSPSRYLAFTSAPGLTVAEYGDARRALTRLIGELADEAGRLPEAAPGSEPAASEECRIRDLETDDVVRIRRRRHRSPAEPGGAGRILHAADLAEGRPPAEVDRIDDRNAPVVRAGDVIAAITSGRLHARVAGDSDLGAHAGPQVVLLRPDPAVLDPGYLAGCLAGGSVGRQLRRSPSTGTHVGADLRRVRIPIPPLERQRELAARFALLQRLDDLAGDVRRRAAGLTGDIRDRLLG